jgi:RecA-family ATPase
MLNPELKESIKKALHVGNDILIDRSYNPWVLEPLIPHRSITILDGLGGSGKSWFALDLSYAISLGQDFLGRFPVRRSGTVLYITAEESPEVFVQRLDMVQKHYKENENFKWLSLLDEDLEISSYLCRKKRGEQIITETAEVLEWLISEEKPILIVLDSLVNFYGLDENSSEDAMYFYDVLKYFIRKYQTSFLLLHHQNKEAMRIQSDDVISFRGSGVLREQARSRIVYKNIKINEGTIARKIKLEKSNYYSKLRDDVLKEGSLYLKFENGVHKYDTQFELMAKRAEEEAKSKGKKKKNKKGNDGLEGYEVDF